MVDGQARPLWPRFPPSGRKAVAGRGGVQRLGDLATRTEDTWTVLFSLASDLTLTTLDHHLGEAVAGERFVARAEEMGARSLAYSTQMQRRSGLCYTWGERRRLWLQ